MHPIVGQAILRSNIRKNYGWKYRNYGVWVGAEILLGHAATESRGFLAEIDAGTPEFCS
jgi:hypothetical protein